MKRHNVFACASLLTVTGAIGVQDADAATSDHQLKEDLRQAICFQNWNKAAELSGLLIASPMITPEHRQTLVDWRYRFSDYAINAIKFDSIPNCEGLFATAENSKVSTSAVNSETTVSSPVKFSSNIDQIKEDLRQAVCTQDWQKAIDISSLLMASPNISPEYRQTLALWRYRFSNYAYEGSNLVNPTDCAGVSTPVEIETFEDNRASIYFDWNTEVARIQQGVARSEPRFSASPTQNIETAPTSAGLTVANVYSRGGTVYGVVENNTGTVYRDIEVYAIGYTAEGRTNSNTYTRIGVLNPGSKVEIPVIVGGGNFIDSDFSILSSTADSQPGPCEFAWQTDSAGRRCGNRAASERPGGR